MQNLIGFYIFLKNSQRYFFQSYQSEYVEKEQL